MEPLVVRPEEAARMLNMSERTLRMMTQAGDAPRAVPLGQRRKVYRVADLRAWVDSKFAEIDTEKAAS
jgi:excisionase family DNA binding protein